MPDLSFGKAREAAAGLTGASDGYVRDAKRIVAKDSSMLERMRDGEIAIQEAHRSCKLSTSFGKTVTYTVVGLVEGPPLTR